MTREEAIRILASSCIPGSKQTEALEILIPELAESEDERMMREFNDWLCEEIECLTNDLRDEKDRRTLNMLCYVLTKVKDWLEKQKEQKPVDYEAELKKCKDNPLYFYDKYVSIKQKSEWSEDDEKIINWAIETLEHENYLILAEKLKSLRPQKLDVSKLKNFDPVDVLNRIKTEWPMAWEKVVWKPSEEQMKYLLMLADYFESEGGTSNTKTLRELYENLKKL